MTENMKFKLLKLVLLSFLIIFLNSCFKEDTPVKPYERGEANFGLADIGEDYNTILYFNLNENRVVKSHYLNQFDLAFETSDSLYFITFNPAIIGGAVNLGQINFDTVLTNNNVRDYKWVYDNYSKVTDSGAIGKWWLDNNIGGEIVSKNDVYVLNLGIDDVGRNVGYRKFQILRRTNEKYVIKFANLNNSNTKEFDIPIDKKYHRVTFSFKEGGKLTYSEPEANSFDLVFTRYAEYFEEINFEPYATNGVLQNPRVCFAYADSSGASYENFTIENYNEKQLSNYYNVLGWDWKTYLFDLGYYTIRNDKFYVIKDYNGYIYKLRFIDFYTPKNGVSSKGNITFEYQKL